MKKFIYFLIALTLGGYTMKKIILVSTTFFIIVACIFAISVNTQAKVRISKKNLKMGVSEKITLKLKGVKCKVNWKSSRPKVATVSNTTNSAVAELTQIPAYEPTPRPIPTSTPIETPRPTLSSDPVDYSFYPSVAQEGAIKDCSVLNIGKDYIEIAYIIITTEGYPQRSVSRFYLEDDIKVVRNGKVEIIGGPQPMSSCRIEGGEDINYEDILIGDIVDIIYSYYYDFRNERCFAINVHR